MNVPLAIRPDNKICTRTDINQVRGRRVDDIGDALSIVTREPAPNRRWHVRLAVQEPITKDRAVSCGPDPTRRSMIQRRQS